MAVNLSPVGGVAAQFFDNNGVILTGGKIYTYAAGTSTPQVTYTSSNGVTAHSNPIILDASGRVPSGEIWLTDGLSYKFVIKDSNDVLIGTYDNIVGINSNFINYTGEQEIQTATASQTVFTLTTMDYQPGTNSLSVFVDGVNQYGPGAQYAYVETSSTVITFVTGLHVGASVKFTTTQINSASYGNAFQISYTPPFVDSVATNVGDKLAQTVSVKDFGAVGDGVTDDSAAFKAAVAALQINGVLIIPATASYYSIDTSGGLTDAVEINKAIEVRFEGEVKATFSAIQANPPFIFNVTGDGVSFTGTGKISGDGSVDSVNTGTDLTMPGLIRVSGDNFTMSGVTIDTPPKVGVSLYDCSGARITNCTFTGGPTTYTDTAYFAIRAYLGGNHNISLNLFTPDATGGMFVNTIFFTSTTSCIIDNNICIKPYEKLAYIVGSYNLVCNNYVTGNPTTIPGTSQAGTLTSVFRGMGNYNKFSNNYTKFCLAGCTIMDGFANEVSGNSFIECGQLGVAVFPSASYTGTFNNTCISDNVITGTTITGVTNTYGVLVNLNYSSTENLQITNNNVSFFAGDASSGVIFAQAASPYSVTNGKISGNRINGGSIGVNGVYIGRVTDTLISDNYIENCSAYAFVESSGAYNSYINNKCDAITSIGISGLSATSVGQQNQYTRASLIGTATLANAISTTVTHGGVAPNARIFLQTAENTAGVLIVSKGWPTTAISGTDFTISMANGTATGITTAQFFYQIIQ